MRPCAVAILVSLLVAAPPPNQAAEPALAEAEAPNRVSIAAPLESWSLLACDPTIGAAVLLRPDGEPDLVHPGEPLGLVADEAHAENSGGAAPSAVLREVLQDRVLVALEQLDASAPDAAWIHLAAGGEPSRVEYLRRRPLPPRLIERPVPPPDGTGKGLRRSPSRRPE